MEFQLSYFKSWKMMLWKCCTQYDSKFGKLGTVSRPQDWKKSVFIPIPKKGNAKECSNYHTIALISHSSKVMLKILQARLQQYVNSELPDHRKSKRVPEKHLLLLYWLCQSFWLCGSQQTGKFFKRWEYQTIWPASEKSVCRSRSNS